MPYREAPNVKGIKRKYFFPEVTWLDWKTFAESEHQNTVNPFISGADGQRMYVGKTVPRQSADYNNPMSTYEIIGAVVKDLDGNWTLRVPWGATVHALKENFVVLSIPDENSFEWVKASNGEIPEYAMRGSLDNDVNEFLYIGRTPTVNLENLTGRIFQQFSLQDFNESLVPSIGKVHSSHRVLYIPVGNVEVSLSDYEVLCLKRTPAPLKVLSRSVIRSQVSANVNNIKEHFKSLRLPYSMLNYLEYPTSLYYGEYMLKGEKLLSDCGEFEITINENNEFICKDNRKNAVIARARDVESFYLHHNRIVTCGVDGVRFVVFASIDFNTKTTPNEYRFKFYTSVDENATKALEYFLIEIFDNDGNVIHTEKIYRSVPIDVDANYDHLFSDHYML